MSQGNIWEKVGITVFIVLILLLILLNFIGENIFGRFWRYLYNALYILTSIFIPCWTIIYLIYYYKIPLSVIKRFISFIIIIILVLGFITIVPLYMPYVVENPYLTIISIMGLCVAVILSFNLLSEIKDNKESGEIGQT